MFKCLKCLQAAKLLNFLQVSTCLSVFSVLKNLMTNKNNKIYLRLHLLFEYRKNPKRNLWERTQTTYRNEDETTANRFKNSIHNPTLPAVAYVN